jgi:hypothetical protein
MYCEYYGMSKENDTTTSKNYERICIILSYRTIPNILFFAVIFKKY